MIFKKIKGGIFLMGTNSEEGALEDYEGPQTEVNVSDFEMQQTTVTNRQFSEFVEATKYQTLAERQGWSFVFMLFIPEVHRHKYAHTAGSPWWLQVPGASWQHPFGPESNLSGLEDHPVVHIALEDALHYCQWKGVSLPTEAQWEYAARGGTLTEFPWGNDLVVDGKYYANTWQGKFPYDNTAKDGFIGTAPVKSYLPNHYDLYQMIGNVWEWCRNPRYTLLDDFNEEVYHLNVKTNLSGEYAIRGGSFLCHCSYCNRYRVAARNGVHYQSTASHLGFRCIKEK